ncbi:uncharacterized protein LOC110832158 isoform X2 [Zootermopsis nevadensis]|uniref:uncharacterized protein LOC110832158 isoform X2 n=1 Tax=Zootermopsis nevadensis TaxID=136037 RepID=UPI000B8E9CAB|nr:uncharacterized protein LOC110832158 isoform X2 [Zootermopsis nevadensis]
MLPSMPLISTPFKEIYSVLESSPDGHLQMEISESSSLHQPSSSTSPPLPEVLSVSHTCSDPRINLEKESQGHISIKALDLSVTANVSSKKSSPLKHVTPILKKYNTHRKGKGSKKVSLINKGIINDQPHLQQGNDKQGLRPIAPKPLKVMFPSEKKHQQEGNLQLDQVLLKDVGEDGTEVEQEVSCGADVATGTPGGSEEMKEMGNDEKTSEYRDVSAEQKDKENELTALMSASITVRSSKGRAAKVMRKKSKQLKDMESTLALLTPDNTVVREEKSYGFAQAYFLKVKERLEGTDIYQEFLHIMNEFGTSIADVSDLYKKVTAVLNQHPDLCEEFVAFLLPEQAMQCGKFMEYLMVTKMRDFFRKLEIYFEKQPQQMQKIYTNLSALSNQASVSVADVRSAILPLLKGNSLLIDNFLALLPHEKPAESLMPEFEDMVLGDVDNEQLGEEDLFETLVVPDQQDAYGGDTCACTCHSSRDDKYHSQAAHCMSCGTRFIHGKVFLQTGKVLRPAKVVFDTESIDDSINRLSAKSKPKGRSRRRAASHTEVASGSKDNSPVKHVNNSHSADACNEVNENGGANNTTFKSNIKSSSPKHARTSKTKSSGTTYKGREKANPVKTMSPSKGFTHEERGTSVHKEEQKQSASVRSSRLSCSRQISLSTKPVVLLHNIASDINSSSLCITVPKVSCRNNSGQHSPVFHDRTSVSSTAVTDSNTPSTVLNNAENTILSIPAISTEWPNPVLPAVTGFCGSLCISLPEIAHDESAVLPPHTAPVNLSAGDLSILPDAIHSRKDARFDPADIGNLSGNVEGSAGSNVETCGRASCEVDYVSECEDMSVMEVAACDTTMIDVTMSEYDGQVSASESAKIDQDDEPNESNEAGCNSDATSGLWTREEDKIILQMFQLDCSMEQTFIKISEQLPLRTLDEMGFFSDKKQVSNIDGPTAADDCSKDGR